MKIPLTDLLECIELTGNRSYEWDWEALIQLFKAPIHTNGELHDQDYYCIDKLKSMIDLYTSEDFISILFLDANKQKFLKTEFTIIKKHTPQKYMDMPYGGSKDF